MKPHPKRFPAIERRKQVLRCAVRVFARSNYRAAGVADIAREAGISEAALYKYFPSKKSMFLEILERMSRRIIQLWKEAVSQKQCVPDILHNMGMTYYCRMIQHPDELKIHFQAVSEIDDPDIRERLRKDHQDYVEFIGSVLQKGIQEGSIRKDLSLEETAWLFNGFGILMNMVKLLSFDRLFNEKGIGRMLDHLIDSVRVRD
ncbi:MAG: TetR/AcrR family transcriptional regulator [Syntrophales bacterium]